MTEIKYNLLCSISTKISQIWAIGLDCQRSWYFWVAMTWVKNQLCLNLWLKLQKLSICSQIDVSFIMIFFIIYRNPLIWNVFLFVLGEYRIVIVRILDTLYELRKMNLSEFWTLNFNLEFEHIGIIRDSLN